MNLNDKECAAVQLQEPINGCGNDCGCPHNLKVETLQKQLGDGREMTLEDAEIILESSHTHYMQADELGTELLIDGRYTQTQFVALGVTMGCIDGSTMQVVVK